MGDPRVITSRFDRTYKDLLLVKEDIQGLPTRTAYFVAKATLKLTKSTPRDAIKGNLARPSFTSPTMTLGELLANKVRQAKGLPWLNNQRLAVEGRKYANLHARGSNFVRSGFVPAVKILGPMVPNKSGAPSSPSVKVGTPKGGAYGTPIGGSSWNAKASIWNSVQGGIKIWKGAPKRNVSKVQSIIIAGVQAGLDDQEAKNREYIIRQLNKRIKKFNNG